MADLDTTIWDESITPAPDSDGNIPCPLCPKVCKPRGWKSHIKSCLRKQRDRDLASQFEHSVVLSDNSVEIGRSAVEDQGQSNNLNWDCPDLFQPTTEPGDLSGLSGYQDTSEFSDPGPAFIPVNVSVTEDPAFEFLSPASVAQGTEEDFEVDSIKTEYHPSSKRPVKIEAFEEYREYDDVPREEKTIPNPHRPFQTRSDFEFAEVCLDAHLNQNQVNRILGIFKKCLAGDDTLNIRDYKHLQETLDHGGSTLAPFVSETIDVKHKKYQASLELHYRSIWDWSMDLLNDPNIGKDFEWDARRLYKYNGKEFKRFIHEPWTANLWWDIQSKLPPNGKLMAYEVYADKTKLSTFGTKKAYPVMIRMLNLPAPIRNSRGYAGGRLVGWLPILDKNEEEEGKMDYVDFKQVIWHESFKVFAKSFADKSWVGSARTGPDNEDILLFPLILILSADYEEQCVMALIRGTNGKCPCPVCLAKGENLFDVSIKPKRRTANQTQDLVSQAAAMPIGQGKDLLKKYGLRPIENAFWGIGMTDLHEMLSFDHMHNYPHGLGGKHLWPTLKQYICDQGKPVVQKVDEAAQAFPRFRGLHHFKQIMGETFNDAMKLEDIVKIAPFITHSHLSRANSPTGYLLLKAIRSYQALDSYLMMEVHTEDTIAEGEDELQTFGECIKDYIEAAQDDGEVKTWNFPKMHMHVHAFDDIRNKGVLSTYDTIFNEPMHHPLKEIFHRRTNFKEVEKQIVHIEHHFYLIQYVRNMVNIADDIALELQKDPDLQEAKKTNGKAFTHVRLGSVVKPQSVEKLLFTKRLNGQFFNFDRKLEAFLKDNLGGPESSIPENLLNIYGARKITEYRFIKIDYESKITWRTCTDYVRCSPEFYGAPRYDCVLINSNEGPFFARLVYAFTIQIENKEYPLALVQPFARVTPSDKAVLHKDIDLRFLRLEQVEDEQTEIVYVQAFVRSAVLVPAGDIPNNYIAFDVLDCDMACRVRELLDP